MNGDFSLNFPGHFYKLKTILVSKSMPKKLKVGKKVKNIVMCVKLN